MNKYIIILFLYIHISIYTSVINPQRSFLSRALDKPKEILQTTKNVVRETWKDARFFFEHPILNTKDFFKREKITDANYDQKKDDLNLKLAEITNERNNPKENYKELRESIRKVNNDLQNITSSKKLSPEKKEEQKQLKTLKQPLRDLDKALKQKNEIANKANDLHTKKEIIFPKIENITLSKEEIKNQNKIIETLKELYENLNSIYFSKNLPIEFIEDKLTTTSEKIDALSNLKFKNNLFRNNLDQFKKSLKTLQEKIKIATTDHGRNEVLYYPDNSDINNKESIERGHKNIKWKEVKDYEKIISHELEELILPNNKAFNKHLELENNLTNSEYLSNNNNITNLQDSLKEMSMNDQIINPQLENIKTMNNLKEKDPEFKKLLEESQKLFSEYVIKPNLKVPVPQGNTQNLKSMFESNKKIIRPLRQEDYKPYIDPNQITVM